MKFLNFGIWNLVFRIWYLEFFNHFIILPKIPKTLRITVGLESVFIQGFAVLLPPEDLRLEVDFLAASFSFWAFSLASSILAVSIFSVNIS